MSKNPVPKQQKSKRKAGQKRSHAQAKLRRAVNRISPVAVWTPKQTRKAGLKQTQKSASSTNSKTTQVSKENN